MTVLAITACEMTREILDAVGECARERVYSKRCVVDIRLEKIPRLYDIPRQKGLERPIQQVAGHSAGEYNDDMRDRF